MARFTRFLTASPRWGILCVGMAFLFSLSTFHLKAQDSTYVRRIVCDLASPAMYGRGMQHRGDSIAADYLRSQLMANGVKPLCENYYQYFRFPQTRSKPPIVDAGYQSQNVCGYLPGETDTMIVFTAHYEHLGMNGDTIFYGAHDNASGTAAVMDLARMASLRHGHYTYVFLLFGGEESGLVGSRHFAENSMIDFSKVKIEPLFEEFVDFDTFSKSDFRAVKVKECVAVPKSTKLLQFTLDDGTGTDRTILSGIHAFYEPEELVGKTLVAITNLPPRPMMGIESCGMLLSAVNNLKDSEDEELHLLMIDNHIPAGAKLY